MRSQFYIYNIFIIISLIHFSCKKEALKPIEIRDILHENMNWHDAIFYNNQEGVIVGGDQYSLTGILYTKDGGESWQKPHIVNNPGKAIYKITINNGHYIATGIDGKVYYAKTGIPDTFWFGQSHLWENNNSLAFNDLGGIIVSGTALVYGKIQYIDPMASYRSDIALNFEPRDIIFYDQQQGLICGYGHILHTKNGGLDWDTTHAAGDFFQSLHYQSTQKTIWTCGFNGSILYSKDDGKSWQQTRNGNNMLQKKYRLRDIKFVNSQVGYTCGDAGVLLKTTDEGKNWHPIHLDTKKDLYFTYPIGNDKLLIGGENGLLKILIF